MKTTKPPHIFPSKSSTKPPVVKASFVERLKNRNPADSRKFDGPATTAPKPLRRTPRFL